MSDLNELRVAISKVSPAVLAQRLGLIGTTHVFSRLPDVPAYYLRAASDRLVPATCATWFQQKFKSCEVHDIAGPHFLLQANPQACARVITQIVRQHSEQ